jgi:hypothetical protein
MKDPNNKNNKTPPPQPHAYDQAPRDWGKATAEAMALAAAGKIVYQEHKSVGGNESFGTLTFKALNGTIHNVRALTGGLGGGSQPGVANGTNARDPRHGNVFIPEYTIHAETWGKSIGVKVFPISEPPSATHRRNMPEHIDTAVLGKSNGCPNHHIADEKIIRNELAPLLKKHGHLPYIMLPSLDKDNPYATHFHKSDIKTAAEHSKPHAQKLASAKVNMDKHDHEHPEKPVAATTPKRNDLGIK